MNRYYLPSLSGEGVVELRDEEAHHALNVLRVRPGEAVTLLNGCGGEGVASVREITRKSVRLDVNRFTDVPRTIPAITLVQSVLKGKAMDLFFQKATELGCARIIPLETDRCVARVEVADHADKVDKWRQVCIEAIKQCGSPWLPEIFPPATISEATRRSADVECALVAALSDERRTIKSVLGGNTRGSIRRVSVWTGPEGDFTPAELSQIIAAGVLPVTLGPRVLRSETAALYCLSVLQHELGA